MEQNNQGNNHGNMCGVCGNCGQCHGGHHMKFHILRWILGIVVILMIFSFGVRIGEFKSAFEGGDGYGSYRMMRYNGGYGSPMMYGSYGQVPVTTAQSVSGTVKK